MIAILVSFLRNHWLPASLAAFALGVLSMITVQHLEIMHLKARLTQAQAESAALEDSNRALLRSITDQNAAIEALREMADKKAALAVSALAQARSEAAYFEDAAARREAVAANPRECDGLKNLIGDYFNERARAQRTTNSSTTLTDVQAMKSGR